MSTDSVHLPALQLERYEADVRSSRAELDKSQATVASLEKQLAEEKEKAGQLQVGPQLLHVYQVNGMRPRERSLQAQLVPLGVGAALNV